MHPFFLHTLSKKIEITSLNHTSLQQKVCFSTKWNDLGLQLLSWAFQLPFWLFPSGFFSHGWTLIQKTMSYLPHFCIVIVCLEFVKPKLFDIVEKHTFHWSGQITTNWSTIMIGPCVAFECSIIVYCPIFDVYKMARHKHLIINLDMWNNYIASNTLYCQKISL